MMPKEFEKGRQLELDNLLSSADEELPGVLEVLRAYGGYEEALVVMREYIDMTSPQPSVTTADQTGPMTGL